MSEIKSRDVTHISKDHWLFLPTTTRESIEDYLMACGRELVGLNTRHEAEVPNLGVLVGTLATLKSVDEVWIFEVWDEQDANEAPHFEQIARSANYIEACKLLITSCDEGETCRLTLRESAIDTRLAYSHGLGALYQERHDKGEPIPMDDFVLLKSKFGKISFEMHSAYLDGYARRFAELEKARFFASLQRI